MRVCLASTSPARLALLRQSGIEPLPLAPDVDEEAVAAAEEGRRGAPLRPAELVLLLGRAKAAEVAERLRREEPGFEGIVIGGDSMFEIGGRVHGKPHVAEEAVRRWESMRGRTGVLHSGHSVFLLRPDAPLVEAFAAAEASVTFAADVSEEEIRAYVSTGEPLQVAGSFTVDGRGGAFIERVEGDPSTVVGMSLSTLRRLAAELGVRWTDLWNRTS